MFRFKFVKIFPLLLCGTLLLSSFLNSQTPLSKSIERGKVIYQESCISCHLGNGEGVVGTFPPLAKADYLIKTPVKAIQAVKFGLKGAIKVNNIAYNRMMPAVGLDNEEVADVMNYINNSWGNNSKGKMITSTYVETIKE